MDDLFDISNGPRDLKENEIRYFGEWVFWENEEEKEEAIQYLSLWKKFFLKKLPDMVQEGHDQIVLKPSVQQDSLGGLLPKMSKPTLGIKIAMKRKLND